MAVAYTKTETSLAVVMDFRPVTIPYSHPNFDRLVELVRDPQTTEADIKPLIDIPAAISTFTGGNVTVTGGRLFYKGYEVKSKLASIIIGLVREGQSEAAKPFEAFMEKAFANPDPRAAMDLFEWVAASNLPITPEGDILAWKAVQSDYYSIRSGPRGKLRHMIGDVVEEPREETDSNPNQTCSRGLHFCSIDYLSSGYAGGGSRIMAVAISPTDVVAFPKDYGNSKGRACRMTVVGEVPRDAVADYYPQGKRVYPGWSGKPTPAYSVGERWRDDDGDIWEVVKVTENNLAAVLVEFEGRALSSDERSDTPAVFDRSTLSDGTYTLVERA